MCDIKHEDTARHTPQTVTWDARENSNHCLTISTVVLETVPRWPWEKKATGAGIEPATSDYICQCSKPLSYWVNKVVAYRYPTHPLKPLSIPPWAARLKTTHSSTQLLLPCWKPFRGDLGKRKRQGLESNQQPPTIYAGALNHWATESIR